MASSPTASKAPLSPLRELREGRGDKRKATSVAECMDLFLRLSPEGRRKALDRLLVLAGEPTEERTL